MRSCNILSCYDRPNTIVKSIFGIVEAYVTDGCCPGDWVLYRHCETGVPSLYNLDTGERLEAPTVKALYKILDFYCRSSLAYSRLRAERLTYLQTSRKETII